MCWPRPLARAPRGARVSLACAIGCADDLAGADALLEEVRAARAESG